MAEELFSHLKSAARIALLGNNKKTKVKRLKSS
jgi:hypothetical protein